MEMRRGSVRIAVAGLLLAACKSGEPDQVSQLEDPRTVGPRTGEQWSKADAEFDKDWVSGEGQGSVDVARICYESSRVEVEFAFEDALRWFLAADLVVDSEPKEVIHVATGQKLDFKFDGNGLLYIRPPSVGGGLRHRIVLDFGVPADEDVGLARAFHRVESRNGADRGDVEIVPSSWSEFEGGDHAPSVPDRLLFRDVVLTSFPLDADWDFPVRSAPRGVVPAAVNLQADDALALTSFCEQELLTRAPAGAAHYPGGPAAAWFGGLVAPVAPYSGSTPIPFGWHRPIVSVESTQAVSALAAVLEGLFAETLPVADRPSQRLGDDAWAVPRYMALRASIGATPFREALREIVDRHRGGDPISFAEVAAVFQDVSGDEAAEYVRMWLAGPARPVVRTQWRFDGERERLLLRIHQVHEVDGNVPAAFPIRIPLRVNFADGSMQDHWIKVSARRELVEVPCDGEPVAVSFDPDDQLVGLCSLEVDE